MDLRVISNLEEHARALGAKQSIPRLAIGRGGVAKEARHAPNLYGFSVEDLYAPIERTLDTLRCGTE